MTRVLQAPPRSLGEIVRARAEAVQRVPPKAPPEHAALILLESLARSVGVWDAMHAAVVDAYGAPVFVRAADRLGVEGALIETQVAPTAGGALRLEITVHARVLHANWQASFTAFEQGGVECGGWRASTPLGRLALLVEHELTHILLLLTHMDGWHVPEGDSMDAINQAYQEQLRVVDAHTAHRAGPLDCRPTPSSVSCGHGPLFASLVFHLWGHRGVVLRPAPLTPAERTAGPLRLPRQSVSDGAVWRARGRALAGAAWEHAQRHDIATLAWRSWA